MSVSTATRTAAVALAGLAVAGVALTTPADAAPVALRKPSTTGVLLAGQTRTVPTIGTQALLCLRLEIPGRATRVSVRPRVGAPILVTLQTTRNQCRLLRPAGALTLHNYGPTRVRYTVTSPVLG